MKANIVVKQETKKCTEFDTQRLTCTVKLAGVELAVFKSTPYVRTIPETQEACANFVDSLALALTKTGCMTKIKYE